jgi:Peptidase family M23
MRRLLAVLAVIALAQAPSAAAWTWPVDGAILRPFVLGDDPYAAGQHRGIDIGASPGTAVRAATDGIVTFAGSVPAGGRAITVRTADGLSVTYLELGTIGVPRGAAVAEGDTIGTIGSASHVHFGIRETAEAQGYLDPLRFLPSRPERPAPAEPVEPSPVSTVEPEPEPAAAGEGRGQVHAADAPSSTAPEAAGPEPAEARVDTASGIPEVALSASPAEAAHASASAKTPEPVAAVVRREASTESKRERAPRAGSSRTASARAGPVVADATAGSVGRQTRVATARPRTAGTPRAPARSAPAPAEPIRVNARPAPLATGTDRAAEARERPVADSARGGDRSVAPVLLLASALLAVAAAVVTLARKRRRAIAAPPSRPARRCSRGRVRPPRLLHACVRSGESGWLAPTTRRRVLVRAERPLPRPRRRVAIESPG